MSRENFEGFFGEVRLLFNIFGKWAKNCHSFGRKFSAGWSKMQSEWPKEHLGEKQLLWKKYLLFLIFFGLWTKYYRNLDEKISVRLSKLYFTCPSESLKKLFFFLKKVCFLLTFMTLVKNLRLLAKKFQRGCHNWFLGIQRHVLRKKQFFEKTELLNHFRTLTEKNCVLLAEKFFDMVVNIAF